MSELKKWNIIYNVKANMSTIVIVTGQKWKFQVWDVLNYSVIIVIAQGLDSIEVTILSDTEWLAAWLTG